MGKDENYISEFQEALRLYGQIPGTGRDQAMCNYYVGAALQSVGKYEEASAKIKDALKLYRQIPGSEREQAKCYAGIGVLLGSIGKHDDGIAKLQDALALYQQIPNTEGDQAICYEGMSGALNLMGKHEEGIARAQDALRLFQQIPGTQRSQADLYESIAAAFGQIGDHDEAANNEKKALKLYKQILGTEREQAKCYVEISGEYLMLGQAEEAIANQQEALMLYQKIQGTKRERAKCYGTIGDAFLMLSKGEEAIANQQESLMLYQQIPGTELEQARRLASLGAARGLMGNNEEAVVSLERASRLFKQFQGTERDQAYSCVNIGLALVEMGKYEEGIARTQDALTLFQRIPNTESEQGRCHANIGVSLDKLGKHEDGLAKLQTALKLYQRLPGMEGEQSRCYGDIGNALLGLGQFTKAASAFESAYQYDTEWWILRGLGLSYRGRAQVGDEDQAVRKLVNATESAEGLRTDVSAMAYRVSMFEEPSVVYSDLASTLLDYGQRQVPIHEERVLDWAVRPDSKTALLEAAFHYADSGKGRGLEDALREKEAMSSVRPDEKLLAEDRELSLRLSKLTILREQLPTADVERKTKLTEDIDGLLERRNAIEAEMKKTALGGYYDRQNFWLRKTAFLGDVSEEFRKPMEMAADLPMGTAVLQYSVGEKESWLLILCRQGVSAYRLQVGVPALPELPERQEATVGQLLEAWKSRREEIGLEGLVRLAKERVEDQAREVKRSLVSRVQEGQILERLGEVVLPASALAELRAKSVHHLIVVPDGCLDSFPLAMLRIGRLDGQQREYLIEEYAISYVPAMTTLETIRKQKAERERNRKLPRGELLAFANPDFGLEATAPRDEMVTRIRSVRSDYYQSNGLRLTALPDTETEALRVASLFGVATRYGTSTGEMPEGSVVVCLGKGASKEVAKGLLGGGRGSWRYVLFSTHGLMDVRDGMLSSLALSAPGPDSQEDGYLQAQEVMNLQLDTDVVMLSACQTGLGRMRSGEGLIGLSGSFFYAGAESVCASLWRVPSAPTTQLVPEFFKQLKKGKVDRAEALRQAQLIVMRSGQTADGKSADYSSPFCWAAFVLMGEYRAAGDLKMQ